MVDATSPLLGQHKSSNASGVFYQDADILSSTDPILSSGKQHHEDVSHKLGWRLGVFVPVLNGIFGVIIFIRLSWIVGQVICARIRGFNLT